MTQHVWLPQSGFGSVTSVLAKARVSPSGPRDLPLIRCCRLVFIAPVFRQVIPARIHRFDELYLFAAPPAFDFLFTIDRGVGIEEGLIVDESSQVVAAGESGGEFVLMLPDTVREVAS